MSNHKSDLHEGIICIKWSANEILTRYDSPDIRNNIIHKLEQQFSQYC